ncbi:RDD family protein [Pseudonocardia xishanensis]|uniref:RDD domain-containing protein n=1 Tax=Pseudonocardia xishanensis TaxID=630995 RepID=A0ABP8S398_9PSEU
MTVTPPQQPYGEPYPAPGHPQYGQAPGYAQYGQAPGYAQYGQYPQYGQAPGYAPYPSPQFPPLPIPDYAPWGARVGSALIDGLIPGVIAGVGALSVLFGSLDVVLIVASVCYVAAFAFALWNSCYRQGRTGQSLGKQVMGTRLVRLRDGGPLGFWPTLGRQLAHVLDSLPFYLGYLWPLWDERRQTFADKVCDTVVVRVG